MRTFLEWGVEMDESFFLDGHSKEDILDIFRLIFSLTTKPVIYLTGRTCPLWHQKQMKKVIYRRMLESNNER